MGERDRYCSTALGDNQKIELLLFKDTETKPENYLHFWINVKPTE